MAYLPRLVHAADMVTEFQNDAVRAAFDALPVEARAPLLQIRELIFEVAAETPGVGRIEETLKWGQPAYLTPETGSGTTIRLGVPKTGGYAVFTHCQSRVIPEFRALVGEEFTYDGNRAVVFEPGVAAELEKLRWLVKGALAYRL